MAYTSILPAESSPLGLAAEHKETEALLKASCLPHVLLRNGWYTENYLSSVPAALEHRVYIGSVGEGRIASAARGDYAAAAAEVLTRDNQAGKVAGSLFLISVSKHFNSAITLCAGKIKSALSASDSLATYSESLLPCIFLLLLQILFRHP